MLVDLELFCLEWGWERFKLTTGAFLLTIEACLLTIGLSCLQWESAPQCTVRNKFNFKLKKLQLQVNNTSFGTHLRTLPLRPRILVKISAVLVNHKNGFTKTLFFPIFPGFSVQEMVSVKWLFAQSGIFGFKGKGS